MNECCEACDGNGKVKGKPAAIAKVLVGLKKKTDLNISLSPKSFMDWVVRVWNAIGMRTEP